MSLVAIQPPLPGACVSAIAPTFNVQQARAELGCTEKQVRDAVDDRLLGIRWAWDISAGRADLKHLRILRVALECFRDNVKCELTEREVYALLFPSRGDKPFILAPQFAIAMTCSDTHVTRLVSEESLPQLRGTSMRAGQNGAAVIAWNIVIAFLRERRTPRKI